MIIRKRRLPSGKTSYQLDLGVVEGKRVRRDFKSRAEAELALADHLSQRERYGMSLASLSAAEVAEVMLCLDRVAAAGVRLTEAVEFFLAHGQRRQTPVTVPVLVERFLQARFETASPRYYRQLGVCLGSLARRLEHRKVHEVTREDLEGWLRASGWAPKTRNNYLGDVRSLFSWARKEGYLGTDPCAGIPKVRLGDGEIGTLTVTQCEALLRAAVDEPKVMGYLVLGLYGGLRPAEIARLDWSAVDLQERTVVVAGRQSKTRQRRVVDLTRHAVAWLRAAWPKGLPSGRICGLGWDEGWRTFRRQQGWNKTKEGHGRWPHNALRHTFASMHYAMHQNEALLQAQMGHESAAMLHRHYRALVTKAEAARFWGLRP